MADFYKGFVYECGVLAPLAIEGRPVPVQFGTRGKAVTGWLPDGTPIEARTVREFVRRYLHRTGAVRGRARTREAHLALLRQGRDAWNQWRRDEPHVQPMLACVDARVDFRGLRLNGYDFSYANLSEARLRGVHLKDANFHQAILAGADLSNAHLERANFCRTDLYQTNFERAWLTGANLQGVQLARTNLRGARLSGCKVYGLSAWDLDLDGAIQDHLTIRYRPANALRGQPDEEVQVEGLDLAAFMYFTLNNHNISRIIDGAASKWVLLLGRFGRGKCVLRALAEELKDRRLVPIIFDFSRPQQRDLLETVVLLAGMSAFVIVEISSPRSAPMELLAIAANYGVPIVPIVRKGTRPFAVFSAMRKFPWVLPPHEYVTERRLIAQLQRKVITPAMTEARRLAAWKRAVGTASTQG